MTESTRFLTSTQAAARLGVKTATLYAYVSRGLLPRHASRDGRASLFDPVDVARLSKRSGARRGAPSDVTVASELSLVDATDGRVWYRGVDALRACRDLHFEELAWWLWTGSFERMNTWRANSRSVTAASRAQASLPRNASIVDRLALISSAVAVAHARRPESAGTTAASDVMACLVDCLPGTGAGGARFAIRVASKLGPQAVPMPMMVVIDAALSLQCEHGLTYPALVARLTIGAGGGVAAAVAAAMAAASPAAHSIARIETALAGAGHLDAADAETDSHRDEDPRAAVLFEMLAAAAPDGATGTESPTMPLALAAVARACGLPAGTGAAMSLIAASAGWIAHALEEQRNPTPFRPRLAYTGRPPRTSTPRRTIDAVRDYLSRQ